MPIGFHNIYEDMIEKDEMVDLSVCLDRWSTIGKKNKNKQKQGKPMEQQTDVIEKQNEIHSVAEGSATLVEDSKSNEVWVVSSSDEEEDVIEIKPVVETIKGTLLFLIQNLQGLISCFLF